MYRDILGSMNRRVQKTTTGTYFITLPKEWVKEYEIKHGSTLEIEIRRDGALVIYLSLIHI